MSSADAALAASAARSGGRRARAGWRLWKTGAVAAALWAGVGGLTLGLPNIEVGFTSWSYTREFGVAALALAALLLLAAVSGREQARPARCAAPDRGSRRWRWPWAVGSWQPPSWPCCPVPSSRRRNR